MDDQAQTTEKKVRVFISYSRKDQIFTEELVEGLVLLGFEPYLDKQDIAPAEPWKTRLGDLILQADTVVFVVSPDAVHSDRCTWEVNESERLSKRILPVVHRDVSQEDIPEQLRQLNFVFFT